MSTPAIIASVLLLAGLAIGAYMLVKRFGTPSLPSMPAWLTRQSNQRKQIVGGIITVAALVALVLIWRNTRSDKKDERMPRRPTPAAPAPVTVISPTDTSTREIIMTERWSNEELVPLYYGVDMKTVADEYEIVVFPSQTVYTITRSSCRISERTESFRVRLTKSGSATLTLFQYNTFRVRAPADPPGCVKPVGKPFEASVPSPTPNQGSPSRALSHMQKPPRAGWFFTKPIVRS